MSKYYYLKTYERWLEKELKSLLGYFTVKGNKVELIANISKFDPEKGKKYKDKDVEKIIQFIKKYFLSKTMMFRLLTRFVRETRVSWFDLPNYEYFVRRLVKKKLARRFKKAIKEGKKLK